jgi:glycosyltransferase involved in cell wall biosynthesis
MQQKKTKVIVSVTNDLFTDQRVDKVCNFLVDEGFDVLLIGRKRKDSQLLAKRRYSTKRMHLLFDKGAMFYANYSVALFFRLLFSKVDVLVSNDLDTLVANYWVSKCKRKCDLVYDTHEYFTEVPELLNRPKVKAIWEKLEASIFPKLKHIYTVNTSIASQYNQKYPIKDASEIKVVRNVAPKWMPTSIKSKAELGLPENKILLIAQGAGINVDRGIEELIGAMKTLDHCCLLIVGDGDAVPQLKWKVANEKIQNVLFFGKRPYLDMMQYTQHATLGFSLDKNTNLNYRFSLPNKIFDYIQASTPVFATRLPEIEKVVTTHKVGFLTDAKTPEELSADITMLLKDQSKIEQMKTACVIAANIECWEHEIHVLRSIYLPLKKIN